MWAERKTCVPGIEVRRLLLPLLRPPFYLFLRPRCTSSRSILILPSRCRSILPLTPTRRLEMLMYARIAFFCRICGEIKRLESTHPVGTLSSVHPHVHTTRFLSVRVLAGRRLAGHQASVRWNTSLQVWLARVVFKFVPIFYFRRRQADVPRLL